MSVDRHPQTFAKGLHTPEHQPTGDVAAPKATENGSAPHATDDLEQGEVAEPDVLTLLVKQLHELGEYVSYYVTAQTDSAKLSLENAIRWMSFAAMGFVIVTALIITATWFLLTGIAEGVSVVFSGRLWIGNMVTGALLLVGLGLAMYYRVATRRMTSRERVVRKYEQRQGRQQAQFGRDVFAPAATAASRDERGYLADQASNARLAMVHKLQDMNKSLIEVADVRSCTNRHPWLVTGSAVAAGFVTGIALAPFARTDTKHTGANSEALLHSGGEGRETPESKKSILFSILGTALASVLQTVVQGSIAAAVAKPRAHEKLKR